MTAPSDQTRELQAWWVTGLLALLVIVFLLPLNAWRDRAARRDVDHRLQAGIEPATFVGREQCIDCHPAAHEAWSGSHHDRAMAVADSTTVRGAFDGTVVEHHGIASRFYRRDGRYFVYTEGPEGELEEFEITHTFGYEPLQQYLVPFPGGRLQCLTIAWDTEREQWFHLYPDVQHPPDDWLHWTRSAQNWNGMCAECHSTNLRKGYDSTTGTFTTTWSEIDVSCEACHGPASRHVEWASIPPMGRPPLEHFGLLIGTTSLDARGQVELCAPCHSRRTELGDYDHTAARLMDYQLPELLQEGMYHADGQILEEVYVYGSFTQSKMYHNDVKCSDCHDVHSLELLASGNQLCVRCHRADVYDSYDHHFHQQTVDGKPSDGALCVKCHMPEQPYMVIDWRADHSLRVPRPDLTAEIGTPNACAQAGCHDDRSTQWSLDAYHKWYGVARKPHYGTILAAGRVGDPEVREDVMRMAEDPLYPSIVRATALSLLERYPGETSMAVLRRALADEEPLMRYTALSSLSAPDPATLAEWVAPLLADPVRAVRMQAAYALSAVPREALRPYQRNAFDAALAEYEAAMSYNLDFAFAGHNLGNLQRNLGRPDSAESYYRAAIEIDELFFPAKVNLAMLLNEQGRNDEAAALLRDVVEAYPEMVDASYSLGLLLVEMGQPGAAVEHLARASAGMPERTRVHYNLGLLLQQEGRDREAEAALRRALDGEPDNIEYLYALADHYVKRERYRDALDIAERMIAAHPQARIGHELKAQLERALRATPRAPSRREP